MHTLGAEEGLQSNVTLTPAGMLCVDLTAALRIKDGSGKNGGLGHKGIHHFSF